MFILVGAGIVGGVGLIIIEIIYHKHNIRREKRANAAKLAITRWKGTIEVRVMTNIEVISSVVLNIVEEFVGFESVLRILPCACQTFRYDCVPSKPRKGGN